MNDADLQERMQLAIERISEIKEFILFFILPAFRMLRPLQLLPAQQYRFSLRLLLPFRLFSCLKKYSRSRLFL